jgi:DNA-directed RNA polymerase, omega subunit
MNMLEPTLDELVNKVGNRYTLVAVIAKRARQIVDESIRNGISNIKPVSEAVTDLEDDCLEWSE